MRTVNLHDFLLQMVILHDPLICMTNSQMDYTRLVSDLPCDPVSDHAFSYLGLYDEAFVHDLVLHCRDSEVSLQRAW